MKQRISTGTTPGGPVPTIRIPGSATLVRFWREHIKIHETTATRVVVVPREATHVSFH